MRLYEDGTENVQLSRANIGPPLIVNIQLAPALAAAAETYRFTFSSDAPLHQWTARPDGERQGLARLPFKAISVRHEQVQIQRRRWQRGQQSPKSVSAQSRTQRRSTSLERRDTKEP